MKKLAIAFAGLAALGFSGAAFAEDGSWTTTTGPAAMSDSDMERVTAGEAADPTPKGGLYGTALGVRNENAGTPSSPPAGKASGTTTSRGSADGSNGVGPD